jgi:DNA-binding CsgD family transcriptional regulator
MEDNNMNKLMSQSAFDSLLEAYDICQPIVVSPQTKRHKTIKSQPFHLDVESLRNLPASVFWMNRERIYLGCNDVAVWAIRVANQRDFVDKRIDNFDTIPGITKEIYSEHDKLVLNNGTSLQAIETIRGEICMSHKMPLYNNDNKLSGLLGLSFIIKNYQEKLNDKLITALSAEKLQNTPSTHKKQRRIIILTKREKECIRLTMLGNTAKETGKILKISNRTVEYYLENARNKLGCTKRSELLNAVVEGGLL